MKKTAIASIALLLSVFSVKAADRVPIDLVVVLDTSSSMYESRKEVTEYIVGPLLTEFLKFGDTFHLLSFSGTTHSEISRRIEGPEDIRTIIARLLLMYPLDPYTDFITALNDVHQYLRELPESRTKTVVIISDGEHAPPPASPNAGLDVSETAKRIEASTSRLKGNGWNFYFIKIPFSGPATPKKIVTSEESVRTTTKVSDSFGSAKSPVGAGSEADTAQKNSVEATNENPSVENPTSVDVTETVSETLASPVVEWSKDDGSKNVGAAVGVVFAEFPSDLGKKSRVLSIPVRVRNPSSTSMYLETDAVQVDGVDRMSKRSFLTLKPRSNGVISLKLSLPDSYPLGSAKILVAPLFAGNIRLMPDQSVLNVTLVDAPFLRFFGTAAPYLIFIIGLLLAVTILLLIIAFLRRSFSAPTRAAARATVTRRASAEAEEFQSEKKIGASSNESKAGISPKSIPSVQSSAKEKNRGMLHMTIPVSGSSGSLETAPSGLSPHGGFPPSILQPKEPKTSAGFISAPKEYSVKKENERVMLSLWVQDQSRNIGKRNVHLMKAGSTLSLGGGHSDFLIFLVPLPHRIADVRFDGETCFLVPRRPDYFPDHGAQTIEDCLGKTIRVVSDKGYELFFKMEMFEDPLLKLNRFLHSIDAAGIANH